MTRGKLSMVVQACNFSYLGGRGRRIRILRLRCSYIVSKPNLGYMSQAKKANASGGMECETNVTFKDDSLHWGKAFLFLSFNKVTPAGQWWCGAGKSQ